jgi:hypothetical protein
MRVEFYREGSPETVVGAAAWEGREAVLLKAEDEATGHAILRIFRPTPVATSDASLRTLSGHGESVVEPGSLEWFRQAAVVRAPKVGLVPRFIPNVENGAGFDPAAQYRPFRDVMARLAEEPDRNEPAT